MTAVSGPAGRVQSFRRHLRQALGKDHNPLIRPVDRSRSRAALLTVLGIGLAVLGSAGAAAADFSTVRHRVSVRAAHLHRVQAVVLTPAQRRTDSDTGKKRYEAGAVWAGPGGPNNTGTVTVPRGTTPGTTVGILVDDTSRFAPPPPKTAEIVADAACLGLFTLGSLVAVLGAGLGIRLNALDRRADQAWQHSWTLLEPFWSGRAHRDNRTGRPHDAPTNHPNDPRQ
ncbi:hypothetical protein F7Q99_34295 [Streptomyces kaniharaensis]|uniref:Uncharacterized protein n=1 Tax=Streptomyces kaniharaensis TaxID=212423 RepID=A0A6N7L0G1_9ACTN|nr:hypothetical protein [Streptomyces kaniharaensis]MQS17121.1 hypothetical protein [Streptomyces kaniharaensis]